MPCLRALMHLEPSAQQTYGDHQHHKCERPRRDGAGMPALQPEVIRALIPVAVRQGVRVKGHAYKVCRARGTSQWRNGCLRCVRVLPERW